jgi:hypothetical protein
MESVIGSNRGSPVRCAEDVQNIRIREANSREDAERRIASAKAEPDARTN